MRVKGSEVGYALSTIEKMMGEKQEEKLVIRMEENTLRSAPQADRQTDLLQALRNEKRQDVPVAKQRVEEKSEHKPRLHL